MIIYNTTFHVSAGHDDRFLQYIKAHYVPAALGCGTLKNPQLATVLARAEGDDGTSYSLQFTVEDVDALSEWYERTGKKLVDELTKEFDNAVAGFTTLMQTHKL